MLRCRRGARSIGAPSSFVMMLGTHDYRLQH
jgi:hypothetical protein